MQNLFDQALDTLVQDDSILFEAGLHEQTIAARLAHHLQCHANNREDLENYFADVEYNRAHGGVQKVQEIGGSRVFVDVVLHGRGLVDGHENLICVEIKKRTSSRPWENLDAARDFIFPNNENAVNERNNIMLDEDKLIRFTSPGDPHNRGGIVEAYNLGVLMVPRYQKYWEEVGRVWLARMPELFVRYYEGGNVVAGGDRLVRIFN